ncbi:hypothetical protein BSL82_01130 [Tardibacter chloracetimidivorans]|uniref:Uncharacterized protein n=1 Tax=Tardibacter chloracetimidivorans TaxID=1921510 RepID=A0A1L3ZR14_9SPHN|nr:hypothetical protein [Tardibacter chloracetimidivorans]API58068.1 hypothetical protein BSL82_01130 [Tardibacter chloracetimidivorans]
MNDMSAVIVPKSDQINADDLISGPRTIRITEVDIRPGTEQPVSIYFENDEGKPWRPCKSMSRVLVSAWGPDAKAYVGRSVTLYRDPKVKWGGMEVGGIRVSHLSHIERDMVMALTATKGKRAPYTVKPLAAQEPPQTAKVDRVAEGVKALVARLSAPRADRTAIAAEGGVVQQRAWLAANRPDLSAQVEALFKPADNPFDEQPATTPAAVQSPEPAVKEDAGQSAAPIPDDAEPGAASVEIPEAALALIGEINGCDTEELLFEVENAKANADVYKAQPAHIRAMIDAATDQRRKLLRGEML